MKRKLICLLIAISLVTASALFAGGKKEDEGGKKIIKLGHVNSPNSILNYAALEFEKALEKRSPNIDVQVFPSGQLGGTLELVQGLQTGAVAVYPEWAFIYEGVIPDFKLFAVHYTFKDIESYQKFIYSDLFKKWNDKLIANAGIRITGTVNTGGVFSWLGEKPIRTIADVKGIKNRCAQMAPLLESWRAYGANPTPLDWGEVYTSLATGVINGLDNPITDMHDEKFDEIVKYASFTENLVNSWDFGTSEKLWQSLTSEEQNHWVDAIKEANETTGIRFAEIWDVTINEMKASGVIFNEVDPIPFRKAIEDNIEKILNYNKEAIRAYKEVKAAGY